MFGAHLAITEHRCPVRCGLSRYGIDCYSCPSSYRHTFTDMLLLGTVSCASGTSCRFGCADAETNALPEGVHAAISENEHLEVQRKSKASGCRWTASVRERQTSASMDVLPLQAESLKGKETGQHETGGSDRNSNKRRPTWRQHCLKIVEKQSFSRGRESTNFFTLLLHKISHLDINFASEPTSPRR